MRIITGRARGLRLTEPKNYDVRPTADRVKEALFSILGTRVLGARVLDLFAGTGNLGLECWSRGAAQVTFVDASAASLKLVRSNIAKCRAEADVEVLKGDAIATLRRLAAQGRQYDLLFCDPPYSKGWLTKVLAALPQAQVLAADGLLVAEHAAEVQLGSLLPYALEEFRVQKYGSTSLSFIRWRAVEPETGVISAEAEGTAAEPAGREA